jgi:hypothetical protein
VKTFLAKHDVVEKRHSPCSPVLALTVKTVPKGKSFQDVVDIKKNVTDELNVVPLEAFAGCFQKLFERCNKCIQVGGDYFK